MSIELMAAVWRNGPATASERFVLLSLADQANDAGHCWPSYATTAKRCCMSRRSVIRIVQRLEQDGWLRLQTRVHAGGFAANGVWLAVDKLLNSVESKPGVVTRGHQGSDTVSPGVVTGDHRGSDRMSPQPSMNPQNNQLDDADELRLLLSAFDIKWNSRTQKLVGKRDITREWLVELDEEARRKRLGRGWIVTQLEQPAPRPTAKCRLCGGRHSFEMCDLKDVIKY